MRGKDRRVNRPDGGFSIGHRNGPSPSRPVRSVRRPVPSVRGRALVVVGRSGSRSDLFVDGNQQPPDPLHSPRRACRADRAREGQPAASTPGTTAGSSPPVGPATGFPKKTGVLARDVAPSDTRRGGPSSSAGPPGLPGPLVSLVRKQVWAVATPKRCPPPTCARSRTPFDGESTERQKAGRVPRLRPRPGGTPPRGPAPTGSRGERTCCETRGRRHRRLFPGTCNICASHAYIQ